MNENPHISPAVITAQLDDASLPPAEFRIFCHVVRRYGDGKNGRGCDSSISKMAEVCRLNPDTVRKGLKSLVKLGWLVSTERPGETTVYGPRFPSPSGLSGGVAFEGGAIVQVEGLRLDGGHPSSLNGGYPSGLNGGYPSGLNGGHPSSLNEGHPSGLNGGHPSSLRGAKGIPLRDTIKVSSSFAESIYQEYPKKIAKGDALKAILKAMKENDPTFLLERTKAYALATSWKERQFIPHPASWFNSKSYHDDPVEWQQPPPPLRTSAPRTQSRELTSHNAPSI